MPAAENFLHNLPEDSASLKAMLCAVMAERDQERQRAEEQHKRAEEKSALAERLQQHADELYVQNLRLQMELARYKKWYYGPRADRLATSGEVAQALLEFAEQLEQADPSGGCAGAGRDRVRTAAGEAAAGATDLASFENLPVTTQVYELRGEQRVCPGCGVERKEIGAEESWQIEYLPGRFERIQHIRKKYACGM